MNDLLDLLFQEVNGLPEANMALKNYAVVREILERDEGIKEGDTVIRLRARKELAFIYFMVKRDFFPTVEDLDERVTKAKSRVGMPGEWMPDELVLEAIELLKEDTVTKQDKLLRSAEEVANNFLDFFKEVQDNNRKILLKLKIPKDELTPAELDERATMVKNAQELLDKQVKITKDLSFVIAELDRLGEIRRASLKKITKNQLSALENSKDPRYERNGTLWDLLAPTNSPN